MRTTQYVRVYGYLPRNTGISLGVELERLRKTRQVLNLQCLPDKTNREHTYIRKVHGNEPPNHTTTGTANGTTEPPRKPPGPWKLSLTWISHRVHALRFSSGNFCWALVFWNCMCV